MAESARQQRMRELGLLDSGIQTQAPQVQAEQPTSTGTSARQQRMMELGVVPDTRTTMSPDAMDSAFRQEAQTTPYLQPQVEQQQNEPPSAWNGLLDNPIVQGAETGLSWAIKPFESVSTGIADTVGATKNLFGSEKRTGFDGNEYTSTPSESRNLLSDLKDIWSQTHSNTSSEAWQGAFPNLGRMQGTDKNWTDVLDFGAQSIVPLDVAPLLKAAKGVKGLAEAKLASNAERVAANELRSSYEDLSLTSRADSNISRTPSQGFKTNDPAMVNNFNRVEAYNAPADSVLEQYNQSMQQKYDPQNLGDDVWSKMNRNEKTQMAEYRSKVDGVNPPETPATNVDERPLIQELPQSTIKEPVPVSKDFYDRHNTLKVAESAANKLHRDYFNELVAKYGTDDTLNGVTLTPE